MAKYWGIAWPDLWAIGSATNNPLGSTIPAELTTPVINAYQAKGCNLFRVAFRWERLQPTLYGALDSAHLARIIYGCQRAAEQGAKVIVDCHGVGFQRPNGGIIGSSAVPYTSLTDFWQRLTQALKNDALAWQGIFALEIMNEPGQGCQSGNPAGTWMGQHTPTTSGYRAGIQGIRNVDTNVKIIVSGECYTGTDSWTAFNNGMVLPDANCIVAGHCYFDASGSGVYFDGYGSATGIHNATGRWGSTPGEESRTAASAVARFDNWLNWLSVKGYKGIVTEFGVPYNNGTDTAWESILQAVFAKLDGNSNVIGGITWTGGGYGIGMWDSWQYNGSQGIGPFDDPGYASGPSNKHWNVLGNYPTADFNDVPPSPPPPTGVVDMYVYRESYENNFSLTDSFNGGSATTGSPSPPYQGTSALAITLGGNTAGLTYTTTIPFDSNSYDNVVMAVYPTGASPATRSIAIAAIDSTGTGLYGSKVVFSSVPAQTWTVISADVQAMCGGAAKSLLGLNISDAGGAAQPLLYADDVRFQAFGSAVTAPSFFTMATAAVGNATAIFANSIFTMSTGPVTAATTGIPSAFSIFTENFDNGFLENGSFGSASTAIVSPQTPYEGTKALGITFGAQYGAAVIRRSTAFSSALYSTLTLTIYSTETRYIGISLIDAGGAGLWGSKYIPPTPIAAGSWTTLSIPVTTLTANQTVSLSGVAISDQSPTAGSHSQMYVDVFGFTNYGVLANSVFTMTTAAVAGTLAVDATAGSVFTMATAAVGALFGNADASAVPSFIMATIPMATTVVGSAALSVFALTTVATPGGDTTAPVLASITPSPLSPYVVMISWTTDEPSTSQVDYGLTTAYGSSTPLDTTLVTNHTVYIGNLTPATTYHFRVKSRDAAGNLVASN